MSDFQYLSPLIAMVFLTFAVSVVLFYRRITNMKLFPRGYFKVYRHSVGSELPLLAEQASRNYTNLFEQPLLFYLNVLVTLYLGHQNFTFVVLWWLFVAARIAHTYVHLWSNKITRRFFAFFLSTAVSIAAWIYLLFREITTQNLLS